MNFETLRLREESGRLNVTLSNPPINLMSVKMVQELFQLTGFLIENPNIRVVVLDSADPEFFVAHFDLEQMEESMRDPSKASKYPDINVLQSLGLAWQNLPQVKIAKVNGRCRGGGFEFILAMDMIFASKRSVFCFPEASAGFVASGGGATRTALAAGPGRALEILLSSRDFTAEEAERYGVINRALPDERLDQYVNDLVGRLVLRSPSVVAMHREVFRRAFQAVVDPLFSAFAAECNAFRDALAGDELQNTIRWHRGIGQTRETELNLPDTISRMLAER
ncbi:enoyl-CoA hydratase/isomerase family protein [Bradyrhizobium manausense]|uniref:enoyl-CoA hydratase/isomerase family protein n=1 Tax=Bradyrhizobium manausense TaxID=989370 RepID=UPI001BA9D0A6|nr:enoyl-CoA hydratase/isomerase family protein [Bradyrhizobium manausense]MBR0725568.1 enoyl-CoA hydratase/isomerase family protein [Bradyrhizobium manausense]